MKYEIRNSGFTPEDFKECNFEPILVRYKHNSAKKVGLN